MITNDYIEYLKSVIRFKDALIMLQDRRIDMMIDYVFDEVSVPILQKLMEIAYLPLGVEIEDHD